MPAVQQAPFCADPKGLLTPPSSMTLFHLRKISTDMSNGVRIGNGVAAPKTAEKARWTQENRTSRILNDVEELNDGDVVRQDALESIAPIDISPDEVGDKVKFYDSLDFSDTGPVAQFLKQQPNGISPNGNRLDEGMGDSSSAGNSPSGVDRDVLLERMLVGQGALRSRRCVSDPSKKKKKSTAGSPRKRKPKQEQDSIPPSPYSPVSDIRLQIQSDNLDDSSPWTYLPLVFALCPAFVGIFFTNGNKAVTDVLLLCIMTMYLHWLVKVPYDWYQDAREKAVSADIYPPLTDDPAERQLYKLRSEAAAKLAHWEILALVICFVGPVLGGFLLHYLRGSLTSESAGGLVSNFNITLFVLTACVRGALILAELVKRRTLHLTDVARTQPRSRVEELECQVQFLEDEIRRLEGVIGSAAKEAGETLRPDVAALTRAMRRYEKNQALQSQEFVSQIQELEKEIRRNAIKGRTMTEYSVNSIYGANLAGKPLASPGVTAIVSPPGRKYSTWARVYAYVVWWVSAPWRVAKSMLRIPVKVYAALGRRL
ncbi:hypothetical protein POJ06DRAFT_220438 [Lipomyces tetrasporus]|uniref:Uncharacterized protein n=1 Tax=Lipomyces tetrasporus TaxID=54092 RepID=A0AAD7QVL5_9ASCO|nr:uncharacterized protein POJ06DRAFT_220438 [Lipomyces tetrasporus]KAJ8102138.1 hypothetical protein POJ06DRAFT_220438 [Lipomyces tetrasporus]